MSRNPHRTQLINLFCERLLMPRQASLPTNMVFLSGPWSISDLWQPSLPVLYQQNHCTSSEPWPQANKDTHSLYPSMHSAFNFPLIDNARAFTCFINVLKYARIYITQIKFRSYTDYLLLSCRRKSRTIKRHHGRSIFRHNQFYFKLKYNSYISDLFLALPSVSFLSFFNVYIPSAK